MRATTWRRQGLATLILVGLLLAAMPGTGWGQAVEGMTFGVVDSDRIIDEYLAEDLRESLEMATEELQVEFNRESAGLDDDAKEELFREYQARLNAIREALIQERLPRIHAAIREVAQNNEITMVLDLSAVHYGGVDLTDEVLARLGVVVFRP